MNIAQKNKKQWDWRGAVLPIIYSIVGCVPHANTNGLGSLPGNDLLFCVYAEPDPTSKPTGLIFALWRNGDYVVANMTSENGSYDAGNIGEKNTYAEINRWTLELRKHIAKKYGNQFAVTIHAPCGYVVSYNERSAIYEKFVYDLPTVSEFELFEASIDRNRRELDNIKIQQKPTIDLSDQKLLKHWCESVSDE